MISIGLDIGTTTLAGVAMDAGTGEVLRCLTRPHGAAVSGEPFARLADAGKIVAGARALLSALSDGLFGIGCIGLTGQMHGIVYLDARGACVGNLYTWQDQRGELPNDQGEPLSREYSRRSGHPLSTGYGALTHAVNLRLGLVPEGARALTSIVGYVGMALCGAGRSTIHDTEAAALGCYDAAAGDFDQAALARMGVDPAWFPKVVRGEALLGMTDRGVPVALGIGDNQAGFIGCVRDPADSVLVSVGTSGQVSAIVRPGTAPPPNGEIRPCPGEGGLMVGFSLCGGKAYALLERLFREIAALAGAPEGPLYPLLNELARAASPDAQGVRVDTAFLGTRANPLRRGAITGLGDDNFCAANLAAATVNGIAEELVIPFHAMRHAMIQPPRRLIGVGNAIRSNPALRAAFERIFALPMRLPAASEQAAFGAALYALAASGKAPLDQARRLIRYLD